MKLKRVLYFAVDRRVLFVPVVFSVWILLRRGMWDNPNLPWAMVISFLVPFAESVWNRHALPPGFRVLYKLSLFALFAGCERAAGLSEIPAPRRRVHRFRRGVGCGAAAYVFAAACIRRRTALDFMSGRVRLRTVRRRGAARRRTMI